MDFPETIDLPQGEAIECVFRRPKINSNDGHSNDDDALLNGNKSLSFDTTTDSSEYYLDEQKLRTQLWDAYRLARVILGKAITKFNLSSSTILHAIRVVAEMKLELIGLHKQVEFYNQKNNSSGITTTSVTTASMSTHGSAGSETNMTISHATGETALQEQIEKLQNQLTLQLTRYEQLDKTHHDFVEDTKHQLQDVFVQLHALPKSTVTESQANDIQVTLQRLIHTVAVATTKPQIDQLRHELQTSQQESKHLQEHVKRLSEEMQEQSQLAELKLETTQSQYEHELALCRDQILVYKEQVANQEEELVYSQRKLEEFVRNTACSDSSPSKVIKILRKDGPKIMSPTTPRSVVTTEQDKELQKLLINLETVVPGLVKSAKKKFKENKANAAAADGSGISPAASSLGIQTNSTDSTYSDIGIHSLQSPFVTDSGLNKTYSSEDLPDRTSRSGPKLPGTDDDDDKDIFRRKDGDDQKEIVPNDSHDTDHSSITNQDEKELETSLQLQKQVSLLLQQVAVQQTTRRVNELKAEIEEAQEEREEEDEELIHLRKQLDLLEEEVHYMTKAEFKKELRFWQKKRKYYEEQLAEMKRQATRKQELKELTQKCDELAILSVEMQELEIIKEDDEETMGEAFELVQARQEACMNGVSRLKSQVHDVMGDYHDFCHSVEHTLIELDASSWLFSDVQADEEEEQRESVDANSAYDTGEEEKKDAANPTDVGVGNEENEELTQLQSDVRTSNKILQLEMELKRRDHELAMAQSKLSIRDRRISELEQQVMKNLGMPSWDSNETIEG